MMQYMLLSGLKNSIELQVTENETAKNVQSGGLDVLATPVLIGLMEKCAWQSVRPYLPDQTDTVGTFIEIKHLSPTPVGMFVSCTSELIGINDRELTFQIEAFDKCGKVAEATHKRFIIKTDRFQDKANEKLKKIIE